MNTPEENNKSVKKTSASPFDFLNSINSKTNPEIIDEHEKEYNAFLINRSLSFFQDTIFYANEMNKYGGVLDGKLHFDFYYHLLPKKKRYTKWIKAATIPTEDSIVIEAIVQRYNCSHKEAKNMLLLFQYNPQEIEKLRNEVRTGGTTDRLQSGEGSTKKLSSTTSPRSKKPKQLAT